MMGTEFGRSGADAPSGHSRAEPEEVSALRASVPNAVTFIECGDDGKCEHQFEGWRDFDDGHGGEQVCSKCGIGAMEWSMRYLP